LTFIKRYWGLGIVLAIFLVWCAITYSAITQDNHGQFVYPLDDTYIHMAMARHFAEDGVWGLTPYTFSSSTSSILWTFLLAVAYFVTGANELTPLVFSSIITLVWMGLSYVILKHYQRSTWQAILVGVLLIVFVPASLLFFLGMEHSLHALLSLAYVWLVALRLERNQPSRWEAVLAPLLVLTRYEALFLIAAACGLWLFRRQWRHSILVGFSAALPVILYGLISLANGWEFLPASILLRSGASVWLERGSTLFMSNLSSVIRNTPSRALLLPMLLCLIGYTLRYRQTNKFWDSLSVMCLIVVGVTLMHIMLARVGWFGRYEAYLFVCGLTAGAAALFSTFPRRLIIPLARVPVVVAVAMVVLFAIAPLTERAVRRAAEHLRCIPSASANIYDQQREMALFLSQNFQGETIAMNDIGAVNYFGDLHSVDIWGIGTVEVIRARLRGQFDMASFLSITTDAGVRFAVMNDHTFVAPESWIPVGTWELANNFISGGEIVSFYAMTDADATTLRTALETYSSQLPADVTQEGYTVTPPPADEGLDAFWQQERLWCAQQYQLQQAGQ
jgi:hypothetical protein